MSTKDAYMQRIDTELDAVHDKLTKFKAQSAAFSNKARSSHARDVRDLEQQLDQVKARLYDLGKAEDHVWEQLQDGVEGIWTTLQSTLEDTVTKFKEEEN